MAQLIAQDFPEEPTAFNVYREARSRFRRREPILSTGANTVSY